MTKVKVFNHQGKLAGSVNLPVELFGANPKPKFLAQTVRVYAHRARQGRGIAKTRGQVVASTKKIYRQKGTGRARHGALSAPIFVGGGVAHGPRGELKQLVLTKQSKKQALAQALSLKVQTNNLVLVTDLSPIKPTKTKHFAAWLSSLNRPDSARLWLTIAKETKLYRGGRNLPNLNFLPLANINSFNILHYQQLYLTLTAVNTLLAAQGYKPVKLIKLTTTKPTASKSRQTTKITK